MERTDITIREYHKTWLEQNPDYTLSKEVREMLDEQIEMDDWASPEIQHDTDIVLGRNQITESLVRYNPLDSPTGGNFLLSGQIGAGKTTTTQHLFEQFLSNGESGQDPLIISIDPTGSFTEFAEQHGGKVQYITGDTMINPMMTRKPAEVLFDTNPKKMRYLNDFFSLLFSGSDLEPFGALQLEVLSRVLYRVYEDRGVELDDHSTYTNGHDPTICGDLIPMLSKIASGVVSVEEDTGVSDSRWEEATANVLTLLHPMQKGMVGGSLIGGSDIEYPLEEDFVNLDMGQIPTQNIALPMFAVLLEVYEWATSVEREVIVSISDGMDLLSTPEIAESLEQMLRVVRHYNVSFFITTGSLGELVECQNFNLWDLCSHKLLHHDESVSQEANKTNLRETHTEYLGNCVSGGEGKGYSEAVLALQDVGFQPVRIDSEDMISVSDPQ